ncbi:MAG: hypothetical protein GY778_02375 [bacterium]|nr:hypothetical protein [bacterium]
MDVAVGGSGIWVMRRLEGSKGVIRINAACSSATMVGFYSGAFDVQEDFCSTGTFTLAGQDFGLGLEGALYINVADAKSLELGVDTCP